MTERAKLSDGNHKSRIRRFIQMVYSCIVTAVAPSTLIYPILKYPFESKSIFRLHG